MRRHAAASLLLTLNLLWPFASAAAGEKSSNDLVIIDHRGKELKIKNWKLTQGTRQLDWLEPAPPNPKSKKSAAAPRGPLYLEFRQEHSTTFKEGIITLIPVASLRKLDYDHDKKTVNVAYLGADDKEGTLAGSIKFVGINRLTIEGDADLGDLGSATVKFLGGDAKHGVKGIRFPTAQPVSFPKGSSVTIVGEDKEKSKHVVQEATALYKTAAGHRTLPYVMFKKTVKVDLGKIAKLSHIESEDKKFASFDFELTLMDGASHTLTMLEKIATDDGSATLIGLVCRVPAGYQLFPIHTIGEFARELGKEEK